MLNSYEQYNAKLAKEKEENFLEEHPDASKILILKIQMFSFYF